MTDSAVDARRVAEYLGISVYTVHQHARTGQMPAFKVGSRWRFRLSEIDAHLSRPRDPWMQSPQSRGRKRKA